MGLQNCLDVYRVHRGYLVDAEDLRGVRLAILVEIALKELHVSSFFHR